MTFPVQRPGLHQAVLSYALIRVSNMCNTCNMSMCSAVVSVDLTDSSMAPGGRGYDRLLTGLKSRLQMKSDFLLSHHPGDVIDQVSVTHDALLLTYALPLSCRG